MKENMASFWKRLDYDEGDDPLDVEPFYARKMVYWHSSYSGRY